MAAWQSRGLASMNQEVCSGFSFPQGIYSEINLTFWNYAWRESCKVEFHPEKGAFHAVFSGQQKEQQSQLCRAMLSAPLTCVARFLLSLRFISLWWKSMMRSLSLKAEILAIYSSNYVTSIVWSLPANSSLWQVYDIEVTIKMPSYFALFFLHKPRRLMQLC